MRWLVITALLLTLQGCMSIPDEVETEFEPAAQGQVNNYNPNAPKSKESED